MEKQPKMNIYLVGDSTVEDCALSKKPRAGWGQMLQPFFMDNIQVINYAFSGRSSKSFIEEGRLQTILNEIEENDFLFIQFGHNDQKHDHRRTEPDSTYQYYLKQFIDGTRMRGATPVLVTSMHRRTFNQNGQVENSLGNYPMAMMDLAKKENVYYVDLWSKSKVLYESLGQEKSKKLFLWYEPGEQKNYPEGVQDDTHFCESGAGVLAKIIATEIKEKIQELASYIKL